LENGLLDCGEDKADVGGIRCLCETVPRSVKINIIRAVSDLLWIQIEMRSVDLIEPPE